MTTIVTLNPDFNDSEFIYSKHRTPESAFTAVKAYRKDDPNHCFYVASRVSEHFKYAVIRETDIAGLDLSRCSPMFIS